MILHDCTRAPNPRRVRMFLAEKGVELPRREVDLMAGEHRSPAFRAKNPRCTVPVLELDDGTCISETLAIWHYLEAKFPDPPLMGRDAREQALVLQWHAFVDQEGMHAASEAYRNRAPTFRGRALPGPVDFEQLPQLAERGRVRVEAAFDILDERLSESPYVAGAHFSIADITAFVAVEFGSRADVVPGSRRHLARWHRSVGARPSAAA